MKELIDQITAFFPNTMAEHVAMCSTFIPKVEHMPHEAIEFNDSVERFHRSEYAKIEPKLTVDWTKFNADLAETEARWLAHLFPKPKVNAGQMAELRALIAGAEAPKPRTVHLDFETRDLRGNPATTIIVDDYAFAQPMHNAHMFDAAHRVDGDPTIKAAADRANVKLPSDYRPPKKPANNRAVRRRAGRKPRG